jgi:hypothetical protein
MWTDEELQKSQKADPEFQWIVKLKEEHQHRPPWEDVSLHGEGDKHYWSMWNQLEFKNGVLRQRYEAEHGKTMIFRTLLPQKFRDEAFHQLHTSKTAAHLGAQKTYDKAKTRFYWKNMIDSISEMCRQCDKCESRKSPPSLTT